MDRDIALSIVSALGTINTALDDIATTYDPTPADSEPEANSELNTVLSSPSVINDEQEREQEPEQEPEPEPEQKTTTRKTTTGK